MKWKTSLETIETRTNQHEGGHINLFDIREGYFGPEATQIERNRNSTSIDASSHNGSGTRSSLRVTYVLGHQRENEVSQEEHLARQNGENKVIGGKQQILRVYDDLWDLKSLRREAHRRKINANGKRRRLQLRLQLHAIEKKYESRYDHQLHPHRLREVHYTSEPGRQVPSLWEVISLDNADATTPTT